MEFKALSIVAVALTMGFCLLGFLDDFIKIRFARNLGLKPYQKITRRAQRKRTRIAHHYLCGEAVEYKISEQASEYYQKIIGQLGLSAIAGYFAYAYGGVGTSIALPFTDVTVRAPSA